MIRTCSIQDCDRPHHANGFCSPHNHSFVRYGDLLMTKRGVRDGEQLAWLEYRITEPFGDDCVEWPFSRLASGGYGYIYTPTKKCKRVTHIILETFVGPNPPDKPLALHWKCHNPPCINPNHLMWGDQRTNMRQMDDAQRRNPMPRGVYVGEMSANAKLIEDEVRELFLLYQAGVTQVDLAFIFNVARSTVNAIVKGRNWKHLGLIEIPGSGGPRTPPPESDDWNKPNGIDWDDIPPPPPAKKKGRTA